MNSLSQKLSANIESGSGGNSKPQAKSGNSAENETAFNGRVVALSDYFYNNFSIDGTDWAKVFGYEFTVYDVSGGTPRSFALPISPSSISIDVPVATSLSVTMKGIVEENNGAPLRRISIRGTSGVLPYNFIPSSKNSSGEGQGIFSKLVSVGARNTIGQINGTVNSAKKFASSASSIIGNGAARAEPLNLSPTSLEISKQTGYTFIHGLINFLDQYLAMKKQKQYKNLRLQFVMHKDKMYWDCTLTGYQIRKMPGSLEYEYDISLTAWRRAKNPAKSSRTSSPKQLTTAKEINALTATLNTLRNARKLVHSSINILTGIRSDIDQSLLTPLREAVLLTGEVVGAVHSAVDFIKVMVLSSDYYEDSYKNALGRAVQTALSKGDIAKIAIQGEALKGQGLHATTSIISSAINYQSVNALDTLVSENENRTSNLKSDDSSPIDTIFKDPNSYLGFIDSFTVEDLQLSSTAQESVDSELSRVKSLGVDDLKKNKKLIEEYSNSISSGLGGASSTYNRVNSQPTKKTYKKLSSDDIILLNALNDITMQYDGLINFVKQQDPTTTSNYFDYYAQIARANNITFENSNSKFFVPFPYGSSLESLAVEYLNNADRWIEIAAINGLKNPYIDEEGFEVLFKSSGSGNSALIPYDDRLYVGQIVEVSSNLESTTLRSINSIDILNSIEMAVTFSGNPDLSKYTLADNAKLKAFFPDTVNSLKLIAIPSDRPLTSTSIKTNPSKEDLTFLSSLSKTDFLLTSDGDLALTSGGDVKISTGLQNIIQAALIKLRTRAGTIITDPEFGNTAQVGVNVSEVNAQQLIKNLKELFADDDRFEDVIAARATISGGAVQLDIMLKIANVDYHLPLTTQLPL